MSHQNQQCVRCGTKPGWVICELCPGDEAARAGYRIKRRRDYEGSTGMPLQVQLLLNDRWTRAFSAGTSNIEEAREVARKHLKDASLEAGLTPMKAKRTLQALARLRIEELKKRGGTANAGRAKKLRHLLNVYGSATKFHGTPVRDLRPADKIELVGVRALGVSLKLSTVKNELSTMNGLLRWAVAKSLIVEPQCLADPDEAEILALKNVREDGRTSVVRPSDDWDESFLNAARDVLPALRQGKTLPLDEHYPALKRANALSVSRGLLACVMTLATGIRSQELAKLRWEELRLDHEVAPHIFVDRVRKNKSQGYTPTLLWKFPHLLPLAEALIGALRWNVERLRGAEPAGQDLIFDQRDKLNREVSKALSAVGCSQSVDGFHGKKTVSITITALRHHHISKLIAAGKPADTVAFSCGTSVGMLRAHYVQLGVDESLAAAAELTMDGPVVLGVVKKGDSV